MESVRVSGPRAEQGRLIHHVASGFSGVTNGEGLLDEMIAALPNLVGAQQCRLFIHDTLHGRVWLHSGTSLERLELDLPLRGCLIGETVLRGESMVIEDLEGRDGVHQDVDTMTNFTTRNMACAPVFFAKSDKVIGVLQALNKLGGLAFQAEDRRLLEEAAQFMAPAVEKIYHAQKRAYRRDLESRREGPFERLGGLLQRWFPG